MSGVIESAPTIDVLGTRIDVVTRAEAVERILALAAARRFAYVVTPNVDHVMKLRNDASFRKVYGDASLAVADGMPLVWASRLLGTPLPERVNGTELMIDLCRASAEAGLRVFFLGGNPGSADKAAAALRVQFPGLQTVGTLCPPFGFEKDAAVCASIVQQVREARPDLLFVGLGAPKQEFWIAAHGGDCGPVVALGVGVSFSLIAGDIRRAPRWMQKTGFEWFWRMLQEPGRLVKRYLIDDLPFFWHLARQCRQRRRLAYQRLRVRVS